MRSPLFRFAIAVLALCLVGIGLWLLESPRRGLETARIEVGETPATVMRQPGAEGPLVVIAHGFAGSRQLMHSFQLTLARAGYVTLSYDLLGHGRNPVPMSGDVTSVDGTTRLLVEELERVIAAGLDLPGVDGRAALVGHSMSSDLVVRAGLATPEAGPIAAISLYSEAVTRDAPDTLLILNGQFEPWLRDAAQAYMAEIGGAEDETVGTVGEGFARRAVAIDWVGHVGILYARQTMRETRDWLDAAFGRDSVGPLVSTGPGILALMAGLTLLILPLMRLLPKGPRPQPPKTSIWALGTVVPAIATPLILSLFETAFLPVLVADYLALHLALYGATALGILAATGNLRLRASPVGAIALTVYAVGVFGLTLDRYVGSFVPIPERWAILLAILPGAILAMLADAALLAGATVARWKRVVQRAIFIGSFALAAALDFERLFFLVLIGPVMVLFFLTYGLMGGAVGRRTGAPGSMGIGLGVALAWALAVTFPLFQA